MKSEGGMREYPTDQQMYDEIEEDEPVEDQLIQGGVTEGYKDGNRHSFGSFGLLLVAALTLVRAVGVIMAHQNTEYNIWPYMYAIVNPDAPVRPVEKVLPPMSRCIASIFAKVGQLQPEWFGKTVRYVSEIGSNVPIVNVVFKTVLAAHEELSSRPGLCFFLRVRVLITIVLIISEIRMARTLFYRYGKFHSRYFLLLSILNPIAFSLNVNPDVNVFLYISTLLVFSAWFRSHPLRAIAICIVCTPVFPPLGILATVFMFAYICASKNRLSDSLISFLLISLFLFMTIRRDPPGGLREYPLMSMMSQLSMDNAIDTIIYFTRSRQEGSPVTFNDPGTLHDVLVGYAAYVILTLIFTIDSMYRFIRSCRRILVADGDVDDIAVKKIAQDTRSAYTRHTKDPRHLNSIGGLLRPESNLSHRLLLGTAINFIFIITAFLPANEVYKQLVFATIPLMLLCATFQFAAIHTEPLSQPDDGVIKPISLRVRNFLWQESLFLIGCLIIYTGMFSRFLVVGLYKHYINLIIYVNLFWSVQEYQRALKSHSTSQSLCVSEFAQRENLINPFIFDERVEMFLVGDGYLSSRYEGETLTTIAPADVPGKCDVVMDIVKPDRPIHEIGNDYISSLRPSYNGNYKLVSCSPVFSSSSPYAIRGGELELNLFNSLTYSYIGADHHMPDYKVACWWWNVMNDEAG